MKLRIKGNSMRLRLLRAEVDSLAAGNPLSETIFFAPAKNACLSYTLLADAEAAAVAVDYGAPEVAVRVPALEIQTWAAGNQVGIYANIEIGSQGPLEVMIEKDFACIDRDDAENVDTFPNPNATC